MNTYWKKNMLFKYNSWNGVLSLLIALKGENVKQVRIREGTGRYKWLVSVRSKIKEDAE